MKASPISRLIWVSEIFRSRVIGWTRSGSALLSMKATALTMHITMAMPQGAEGAAAIRCVAFRSKPASLFFSCDWQGLFWLCRDRHTGGNQLGRKGLAPIRHGLRCFARPSLQNISGKFDDL